MILKKLITISIISLFALTVFTPAFVQANEDAICYLGYSWMSGGANDIHFFSGVTGKGGVYGSINLAIKTGNDLPKRAVNDAVGGHFGFMLGGSDAFAWGLGGIYGYSKIGTGEKEGADIGHYGLEIPFAIMVGDELPIFVLPFYEILGEGRRVGSNIVLNFQAMEPLSIHAECGFYNNSLDYKDSPVKSGFGFNWLISIGIDFF